MLDGIKCRIEYEIKIKFEDVSQESTPLSNYKKEETNNYYTALNILGEASHDRYDRIHESLTKQLNFKNDSLPTFFKLTKNHPHIMGSILKSDKDYALDQDMVELGKSIEEITVLNGYN